MGRLILMIILCLIITITMNCILRYFDKKEKNESRKSFEASIDAVAKRVKNIK